MRRLGAIIMLLAVRFFRDTLLGKWRVDLPSYVLLECDYDAGTAVVDVPPEDVPADKRGLIVAAGVPNNVGASHVFRTANDRERWRGHLALKYGAAIDRHDLARVV